MEILANTQFSGGGLMDLGLELGGVHVQQSFEIDPVCCKVLRANFPNTDVRQIDMRTKLVAEEKPCDVVVATYPCNKYSNAGHLHGVCTGDELYLHFFRHLAISRPECYGLENVPGMRKFPVVMEAMTRLPDYYINVFCPVRSQLWLPQRRDRLIIIGSKKPFAWREPKATRRVSLREILEKRPQIEVPKYVYDRLNGKYRDQPIISDPARGDIAPTCVAHYSKDLSTRLVVDKRFRRGVRPYTVREYARLQGLPDSFVFPCSDQKAYQIIGNGVSIPVGIWLAKEFKRYFRS
jgi:DNA (cytosine-5)-methyltransferase 1